MMVKVPSLRAMRASGLMEAVHDLHNISDHVGFAMTVDALNVKISDVLEEIKDVSKSKMLYEQYAKDPVSTIDVMVSNQRENLQIIKEFVQNAKPKSTDYFANSSVYADIKRYLRQQQLQNDDEK